MEILKNLDIKTGVQTAFILALLIGLLCFFVGYRTIRSGSKLRYFRKRRDMLVRGWRFIFASFALGVVSALVNVFAEPMVYRVYPPSPTITLTPSITITPSISPTPSITVTPSVTNTPSETNTPSIPEEVLTQFLSTTTPVGEPVFSAISFSRDLDKDFSPVDPGIEFANPIERIVGIFSYDGMTPGAQWTAIWYRDGEMVHYETLPWDGGSGGYGFTIWEPNSDAWLPGTYVVQLFVGNTLAKDNPGTEVIEGRGEFFVTGNPPTPTITVSPTITTTPSPTIGPSPTPTDTFTPTVTITPTITKTPTVTLTTIPTSTLIPSLTPLPTDTRLPTLTSPPLLPTYTRAPTLTPTPR